MKKSHQRHPSFGVSAIEAVISPNGDPVIGLYLFMAYGRLMRTMGRDSPFAAIKPVAIGVPALLKMHPGLSQTELADMMGVERMTAGMHVDLCVRKGLVDRRRSKVDRRRYELFVSAKGMAKLRQIEKLIPKHEEYLFQALSRAERAALYRILVKLVEHHGARKEE